MKIYLAGPIFFYGDYLRNIEWATKIRERFPNVYLYSPVENTDINGESRMCIFHLPHKENCRTSCTESCSEQQRCHEGWRGRYGWQKRDLKGLHNKAERG